MTALQPALFRVSSMSADAIAKVDEFQRQLLEQPQVRICTLHTLHAGVYSRTVRIPAGCAIAGVVVKISTLLIVRGSATVYDGAAPVTVTGYAVLPASAGRKQAFLAHEDTDITMVFATEASSVEEAEDLFTDEGYSLASRHDPSSNTIIITGE
jgi:hypothetical protein